MKPRECKHLDQDRRNIRFGMRWVWGIMLSVAVLLGQSFPVMADHGSNLSAIWVEICGDGGTYFVQVDEDGQKQESECSHCDYCIVPMGDVQADNSPNHNDLASLDFTNSSYLVVPATLPDNPEQYWSACRGPPIVSVENKMTPNTSLTIKEPNGSTFIAWSIPCV